MATRIDQIVERELRAGIALDPSIVEKTSVEANVIATVLRASEISVYADLGCWFGFLLGSVLSRCTVSRAVAIDGVPAFLRYAGSTIPHDNVEFLNAIIIPRGSNPNTTEYRVDPSDSSKAGVQASNGPLVEGVPIMTVEDLAEFPTIREALNAGYVKIDLEGIDLDIVCDIVELGFRPRAIHFEVVRRNLDQLPDVLDLVGAAGYEVPRSPLLGDHRFYSVVATTSTNVVVGFEPSEVYWS